MGLWRALFFDEVGLHGLRSWKSAFFALAFSSAILAFPTGQKIVLEAYLRQSALSAFALSAVILALFGLARLSGSQATLEWFFKTVATVTALGLAVSFAVGWVFIFLGQALKEDLVTKAAFSLLPFYSFALFGWGVEKSAHLHTKRAFGLAAIAIAFFVLLHFGLEGLVSGV